MVKVFPIKDIVKYKKIDLHNGVINNLKRGL